MNFSGNFWKFPRNCAFGYFFSFSWKFPKKCASGYVPQKNGNCQLSKWFDPIVYTLILVRFDTLCYWMSDSAWMLVCICWIERNLNWIQLYIPSYFFFTYTECPKDNFVQLLRDLECECVLLWTSVDMDGTINFVNYTVGGTQNLKYVCWFCCHFNGSVPWK